MIHSAILYLVVGFLHGRNGVLSELKKNYSFPLSARASLRCSFEVPRSAQSFVRSAKVIKFLKAEFHAILQYLRQYFILNPSSSIYPTSSQEKLR
nr:hypothetical protein CFP56_22751 [Quercus suber]